MTNTPHDPFLTPAAEAVLKADRLTPTAPKPSADVKVLRALISLLIAGMATLGFFFAYELITDHNRAPEHPAQVQLDVREVTLPDGTTSTCVIAPRAMDCEFISDTGTWGD